MPKLHAVVFEEETLGSGQATFVYRSAYRSPGSVIARIHVKHWQGYDTQGTVQQPNYPSWPTPAGRARSIDSLQGRTDCSYRTESENLPAAIIRKPVLNGRENRSL